MCVCECVFIPESRLEICAVPGQVMLQRSYRNGRLLDVCDVYS